MTRPFRLIAALVVAGACLALAPVAADAASVFAPLNVPGIRPVQDITAPDGTGAAGPSYYVEATDANIAVYRRGDLGLVSSATSNAFTGLSGCGSSCDLVDPTVIFDPPSGRYFFSYAWGAKTRASTGFIYGWSRTDADPANLGGGWCVTTHSTGSAHFTDRPKLAVSGSQIIIGTNNTDQGTQAIWTAPKPPAGGGCASAPASLGLTIPGTDGEVGAPVPAISTDGNGAGYVVGTIPGNGKTGSNSFRLYSVDGGGTVTLAGTIVVPSFTPPPPVSQGNGGFLPLDAHQAEATQAVEHFDPDAGRPTIWTQHTIADPNNSGRSIVRWYELMPTVCGGGSCPSGAVRQQGDIPDPNQSNWVFNGAISPTLAGNEAMIDYNVAGPSLRAQVRARARYSSTPFGVFGDELTLATSGDPLNDSTCGSQGHTTNCRWGNYPSLLPDPINPHATWGTNQFVGPPQPSGFEQWQTQNFELTPPPPPLPPAPPVAVTPHPLPPPILAGSLKAKGGKLRDLLKKGLRVNFSSTVPAWSNFGLLVSGPTSKALHISKAKKKKAPKAVAIAKLTKLVGAGNGSVVLKLTASSRKRLTKLLSGRHPLKKLSTKLTITLTDSAGHKLSYAVTLVFRA